MIFTLSAYMWLSQIEQMLKKVRKMQICLSGNKAVWPVDISLNGEYDYSFVDLNGLDGFKPF